MFLADAMTWTQVGVIATVAGAIAAIAVFFTRSNVQVSPEPGAKFTTEPADQFARKHELERLDRDLIALAAQRSSDVNTLHEKINSVDRKVAGLETSTVLQNQKLSSMDAKLDRLIERKTGA